MDQANRRLQFDPPAFGCRTWFQMRLAGGPQGTAREQAWEAAARRFKAWMDKSGEDAQDISVESVGEASDSKFNEQPWLAVPRWKLNRAVRKLPRGYWEVFEMHERLGYTHKEIADSLNCSVGHVEVPASQSAAASPAISNRK